MRLFERAEYIVSAALVSYSIVAYLLKPKSSEKKNKATAQQALNESQMDLLEQAEVKSDELESKRDMYVILGLIAAHLATDLAGPYYEVTREPIQKYDKMGFMLYIASVVLYLVVAKYGQKQYESIVFAGSIGYMVLSIWSVSLFFRYGEANLQPLGTPTGRFGVGMQELYTEKRGQHVLVFYPTSKDGWLDAMRNEDERMQYQVYGEKTDWANAQIRYDFGQQSDNSLWYRFADMRVDIWQNGEPIMPKNHTKLSPVIFSHGFACHSGGYVGHMRELASHGHVVFGIDHLDGTCTYTETKKNGKLSPFYYDDYIDMGNLTEISGEIDLRVAEIQDLMDEFSAKDFLQKKLAFFSEFVSLDLDKIIVDGHSHGAMTSLAVAAAEPERIKACLALDPWFFGVTGRQNFSIPATPTLILWSEHEYTANTTDLVFKDKFVNRSRAQGNKNMEQAYQKYHIHAHMEDGIVLEPLERYGTLKNFPLTIYGVADQYLSYNYVQFEFLKDNNVFSQFYDDVNPLARLRRVIKALTPVESPSNWPKKFKDRFRRRF